jgi:hypothetical protein
MYEVNIEIFVSIYPVESLTRSTGLANLAKTFHSVYVLEICLGNPVEANVASFLLDVI